MSPLTTFEFFIHETNRFVVAVGLYSNLSQKTSN